MEYVITKQQHGFTVAEASFDRMSTRGQMWAYSTLDEALKGLKELYSGTKKLDSTRRDR